MFRLHTKLTRCTPHTQNKKIENKSKYKQKANTILAKVIALH